MINNVSEFPARLYAGVRKEFVIYLQVVGPTYYTIY